ARLVASYDDGDWVALVLDDVEGRRPPVPWTTPDIDAVTRSLSRVAATAGHPELPPFADVVLALSAWDDVAANPDGLDPGLTARLPEMLDHQARAREVTRGDALVHWDARSDNILIRPDGEAVLLDWAWACRGVTWLDTLLLAVDFVVQGGPDPDDFLRSAGATRDVPGVHLQSVVACMVGVWSDRARRPAPPGLPTIRAWQGHCARGALRWLDEGTVWD
ncbi:MAG TPA: aminoglycoside phosphotransferase family protein, partial [Actinomycetes bacterium]|nr:aminoglycoside phosphotransferase family protein [Actinomycetes bacterium]